MTPAARDLAAGQGSEAMLSWTATSIRGRSQAESSMNDVETLQVLVDLRQGYLRVLTGPRPGFSRFTSAHVTDGTLVDQSQTWIEGRCGGTAGEESIAGSPSAS
jgi:hypothetical protein